MHACRDHWDRPAFGWKLAFYLIGGNHMSLLGVDVWTAVLCKWVVTYAVLAYLRSALANAVCEIVCERITHVTRIWRPRWWWRHWNFAKIFDRKKLESLCYCTPLFCDSTFSHFGTIPACDVQTDRQTDRHMTTAYSALVLCHPTETRPRYCWKQNHDEQEIRSVEHGNCPIAKFTSPWLYGEVVDYIGLT